jgi:hypothetical protein
VSQKLQAPMQRDIRKADGVHELLPGEVRQMNLVTGTVSERAEDDDDDKADYKFAVIGAHSVWGA